MIEAMAQGGWKRRGALFALQPAAFTAAAANVNGSGTGVNPFAVTQPPPQACSTNRAAAREAWLTA